MNWWTDLSPLEWSNYPDYVITVFPPGELLNVNTNACESRLKNQRLGSVNSS